MHNLQQLFTDIAPTYDKLNRWLSLSRDRQWRMRTIEAISARLEMRVVDLCAGTLDLTATCLKRFPQAQIVALDFSQKMLDLGIKKIPHVFHRQVELKCTDALDTGLPERCADVVMCAFGMRNLPNQELALREVKRLLRIGGELVILEFFQPQTRAARMVAKTYGRFAIPLLGGLVSKNREAYKYLRDSSAAFYSLAAYRGLLSQHGFQIRRSEYLSGGICAMLIAENVPA